MISGLLDIHPVTSAMLFQIGLFTSVTRAQRRMLNLARRKKVKYVGPVLLKDRGRPEHVFCRWTPKSDNLTHEIRITQFFFALLMEVSFTGIEIVRGYDTDRKLRPDAEFIIDGVKYLLEMDCGTMTYRDIVRKRFKKYETYDGIVIWIALTDARMNGLRTRGESLRTNALFTTLPAILAEPFGGVLIDFDGQIASIPKPGEKSGE